MQQMNLHSLLKIDEMANDFSEEYFQKLYNFEKKKWLSYKLFKKSPTGVKLWKEN